MKSQKESQLTSDIYTHTKRNGMDQMLSADNPPDAIVIKLLEIIPPQSSLFEFGAGKGRNALPLAAQGHSVYVQDKENSFLESIRNESIGISGGNIFIEKAGNAFDYTPNNNFDAFLCIRLLHFLSPEEAKKVLSIMQKYTNDGGYNVITFFTDETIHKKEFFFPSKEELQDFYSGWKIVHESDPIRKQASPHTNGREMIEKSILFQKLNYE